MRVLLPKGLERAKNKSERVWEETSVRETMAKHETNEMASFVRYCLSFSLCLTDGGNALWTRPCQGILIERAGLMIRLRKLYRE